MNDMNGASHPRCEERTEELSGLVKRVEYFMKTHQRLRCSYQRDIAQGGIALRQELLLPDYGWCKRAVGLNLQEADGFHGSDFIGVMEQKLKPDKETTRENPRQIGVVTYESGKIAIEGGKGILYAYAIFNLDRQEYTSLLYELPRIITNGAPSNGEKTPITLEKFLSAVYEARGKSLKEANPVASHMFHLRRSGRSRIGQLKHPEPKQPSPD